MPSAIAEEDGVCARAFPDKFDDRLDGTLRSARRPRSDWYLLGLPEAEQRLVAGGNRKVRHREGKEVRRVGVDDGTDLRACEVDLGVHGDDLGIGRSEIAFDEASVKADHREVFDRELPYLTG